MTAAGVPAGAGPVPPRHHWNAMNARLATSTTTSSGTQGERRAFGRA
jgi:hypothetical protein